MRESETARGDTRVEPLLLPRALLEAPPPVSGLRKERALQEAKLEEAPRRNEGLMGVGCGCGCCCLLSFTMQDTGGQRARAAAMPTQGVMGWARLGKAEAEGEA